MPLAHPIANRVQPDGRFATLPHRGAFMGNRGCLHRDDGTIARASASRAWIICTLNERPDWGRHPFPAPGRWTPLFFLDEAVALAAGHRPCARCRRAAYRAYGAAWARAFGALPRATEIDLALQADRRGPKPQAPAQALPNGAFFRHGGQDWLAWGGQARPYLGQGYGAATALPSQAVTVLTPAHSLAALAQGYHPALGAAQDRPAWPGRDNALTPRAISTIASPGA